MGQRRHAGRTFETQQKGKKKEKKRKQTDRQTDYIHQSGNRLADATTAAADVDGVSHLKNATRRQSQSALLSPISLINPLTGCKFVISDTRLTLWYPPSQIVSLIK